MSLSSAPYNDQARHAEDKGGNNWRWDMCFEGGPKAFERHLGGVLVYL